MSSNLACVGFEVPDEPALLLLIDRMRPSGVSLGQRRSLEVVRLEDESGARLVVAFRRGVFHELLPSIAGDQVVRLTGVTRLNDQVHRALIAGEDGSIPLALELEQGRLIGNEAIDGMASIIAFGTDVDVFDDAQAFSQSRASLIDPEGRDDKSPPPIAAELGMPWPPRMGPESIISYGLFGPANDAEAYARLNGTVIASERRTNQATGQEFVVARVRTAETEVSVGLGVDDHPDPPPAGSIIAGTVFVVGSVQVDEDSHGGDKPRSRGLNRVFGSLVGRNRCLGITGRHARLAPIRSIGAF